MGVLKLCLRAAAGSADSAALALLPSAHRVPGSAGVRSQPGSLGLAAFGQPVTQFGGGEFTEGVDIVETQPCLAFIDTYSEQARAQLGIPDTDVKIMVLQHSALGVQVDLRNGDTITLRGDWRVIRRDQDPARATWTVQARPV